MARKSKRDANRRPQSPPSSVPRSASPASPPPRASTATSSAAAWRPWLGAAFLALSLAMSFMLVMKHVRGINLPGCGPGSACDQLDRSYWGSIPPGAAEDSLRWPVSFAGLAYFAAALAAWAVSRGNLPTVLRWVARLGALMSLAFCAIILQKWLLCEYCLAVHAGNFAFWITMESSPRRGPLGRPLAASVAVYLAASVGIGLWDHQARASAARKAEGELAESIGQIAAGSAQTPPTQPASARTPATQSAPPTQPAPTSAPPPPAGSEPASSASTPPAGLRAFTGRYRWGPEAAPIRIVMITDYQCPDCRQLEKQATDLMRQRTDVSLSIKHFPFCTACNPRVPGNLHPNACWAARAAEAAGILWGDAGFFKMHEWLFARGGAFTSAQELTAGVRQLGYEPGRFLEIMQSDETLKRVQDDIAEAVDLGLYFTPMIFINGVELKGWTAPGALTRAVEELGRRNLPARTAADDRPPLALQKYVDDWRDEQVRNMPADQSSWHLGAEAAPIRIVLWGDYQEEGTAAADAIIRRFLQSHNEVQYSYRHCPFNNECNPSIPFGRHPLACWSARAAEAAGRLGGNDAFWRMHAWLMEQSAVPLQAAAKEAGVDLAALRNALYTMSADQRQKGAAAIGVDAARALATMQRVADESLDAAAAGLGLDAAALRAQMNRPDILTNVQEDVQASKQFPPLRYGVGPGVHGIPSIFINGKYVPRWQLGNEPVLELILEAAVATEPSTTRPGGS